MKKFRPLQKKEARETKWEKKMWEKKMGKGR
jgi:hypothetical protein